MRGQITKIDPLKQSNNGKYSYYRLYLKLEDDSFAMTDIVPTFRNYAYWKDIIKAGVGTWIGGLVLINENKVDADSQVFILTQQHA